MFLQHSPIIEKLIVLIASIPEMSLESWALNCLINKRLLSIKYITDTVLTSRYKRGIRYRPIYWGDFSLLEETDK